ncbi:ribosomal protein S20 [Metamycoplasma arthritidis]|uniref:Small ribosomal subunit protein bS20 n=1 Tax=Metamycoplasma arthritidis (strain 158L3-1) TaxID=243272 RepID=RS20_META1|nr:30S ribosomal protein S20 [Metamycoplasma arthritidis]B3PMA0.1 RecName: Full=Small ribosomal subunit protein bS20; AltName: Full=30S ribosomal protein S20 [Metamycoplasma arthritidis 158L3-1]ACF07152.1 ribosomal protein S20 [Metamycoplasma arthritidis 158L3-1]VEU78677.1 ribosomal protein S20 [Metamycoplasma arthritidis]
MANIKSKQKAILYNQKANAYNSAVKSTVKTAIKKAKLAADQQDAKLSDFVSKAHHEIDKAVSKGVLHKNNGSRKASRLDAYVQSKQQ